MGFGEPKTTPDSEESQERDRSRRRVLSALGGAGVAALAGCAGRDPSSDAATDTVTETGVTETSPTATSTTVGTTPTATDGMDTLNVAFKPVFPFLQFPVMQQRGYLSELAASVNATNFADKGLTIVSAYAKGDIDVSFMGITPVIKMRAKGLPGRVTAANHKNGFAVMANKTFAGLYERHGADAFRRFREQTGRKFTFATFPKASVAYHLVHIWLDELGVSPAEIEIKPMAGGGPVKRALLAEQVDGTFVMEPIRTAVAASDAPFEQITWSGAFMNAQPGGVVMMHDRVWRDHPETARRLLEQHAKATKLISERPEEAATAVSDALNGVPRKVAARALGSKVSNYITDPREIMPDTRPFVSGMHSQGQIPEPVSNEDLFAPSVFADE